MVRGCEPLVSLRPVARGGVGAWRGAGSLIAAETRVDRDEQRHHSIQLKPKVGTAAPPMAQTIAQKGIPELE